MAKLQRKHHQAVAKILADAAQTIRDHPDTSANAVRLLIGGQLEKWLASEDPTFDAARFRHDANLIIAALRTTI